jgi:hypothetical protein
MMGRGRPPIGEAAMSTAERQRRYLDKIRGTQTSTSSSLLEAECAKLKGDNATLKRLLEGAHEHIRKLEARRERPRPRPKAQPPAGGDEEMQQKLTALRRKNAELRKEIRAITYAPHGTLYLKQGERRKILSALHPDGVQDQTAKRRLEIAFQFISDLFDKGRLREFKEHD